MSSFPPSEIFNGDPIPYRPTLLGNHLSDAFARSTSQSIKLQVTRTTLRTGRMCLDTLHFSYVPSTVGSKTQCRYELLQKKTLIWGPPLSMSKGQAAISQTGSQAV